MTRTPAVKVTALSVLAVALFVVLIFSPTAAGVSADQVTIELVDSEGHELGDTPFFTNDMGFSTETTFDGTKYTLSSGQRMDTDVDAYLRIGGGSGIDSYTVQITMTVSEDGDLGYLGDTGILISTFEEAPVKSENNRKEYQCILNTENDYQAYIEDASGQAVSLTPGVMYPLSFFTASKYCSDEPPVTSDGVVFTFELEVEGEVHTILFVSQDETVDTRHLRDTEVLGELPSIQRAGYGPVEWIDCNGNPVTAETLVSELSEHASEYRYVITAKWTPIVYSITYDLDGGTGAVNPTTYTVESNPIWLDNPTKDGYTFDGWTGTGLAHKTLYVTIPTGSTGDREYLANWIEDTPEPEPEPEEKTVTVETEVIENDDGSVTDRTTTTTEYTDGSSSVKVVDITEYPDGSWSKSTIENDHIKNKDGSETWKTESETISPDGTKDSYESSTEYDADGKWTGYSEDSRTVDSEGNESGFSTEVVIIRHEDGSETWLTREEVDSSDGTSETSKATTEYDPEGGMYEDTKTTVVTDPDGNDTTITSKTVVTVHEDGSETWATDVEKTSYDGSGETTERISQYDADRALTNETTVVVRTDAKGDQRECTITAELGKEGKYRVDADLPATEAEDILNAKEYIDTYDYSIAVVNTHSDDGQLIIPEDSLVLIGEYDYLVSVSTFEQQVVLDADVVDTLVEKGGEAVLIVERAYEDMMTEEQAKVVGDSYAIRLYLTVGGGVVSKLGGKAEISVAAGYKSVAVYYVQDNGDTEFIDSTYDEVTGKVYFEVEHFSIYMVEGETENHSLIIMICALSGAFLLIILIVTLYKRRKRR